MNLEMSPITLLVLILMPVVSSSPVPLGEADEFTTNVRLIKETYGQRSKRAATTKEQRFPDHVAFGISFMDTDDVILNLKRVPLLPTTQSDSEGVIYGGAQTASVYTDMFRHSSMIVRREASYDEYTLKGTFHHSGKEWDLQPLSRDTRSAHTHRISALVPNVEGKVSIPLKGDTIYSPDYEYARPSADHLSDGVIQNAGQILNHTIEVAFIVDYGDYAKWSDGRSADDATSEIRLWYTFVAEMMNMRFQNIKSEYLTIRIRVVNLHIFKTALAESFLTNSRTGDNIDGMSAINAMDTWLASASIPADHYMHFTGHILDYYSAKIAGLNRGEVCEVRSISIVENVNSGVLGIYAAHELGHALSSGHDNAEGCQDDDQYIMAAKLVLPITEPNLGNIFKFSNCSIDKMVAHLRSYDCTLETDSPENISSVTPEERSIYTIDKQCETFFQDSDSKYCEDDMDDYDLNICEQVLCSIPDDQSTCQQVHPLPYTSCGEGMWCDLQRCVPISSATTPETTVAPKTKVSCWKTGWKNWIKCFLSMIF